MSQPDLAAIDRALDRVDAGILGFENGQLDIGSLGAIVQAVIALPEIGEVPGVFAPLNELLARIFIARRDVSSEPEARIAVLDAIGIYRDALTLG